MEETPLLEFSVAVEGVVGMEELQQLPQVVLAVLVNLLEAQEELAEVQRHLQMPQAEHLFLAAVVVVA
jgi:hypothetical protein